MISKVIKTSLLFISLLLIVVPTWAAMPTNEIETEDLPTESVVPILDSRKAVMNRLVPLAGRLELGVFGTSIIDEMFFNSNLWGVQAYYYVNEDAAWGFKYASRASGLSSYSDQFKDTSAQVDLNKAPAPSTSLSGSYRWSFLYGKLSFSKSLVLPTVISAEGDLGVNKVENENLPSMAAGITHKLFLKRHLNVALGYRLLVYQTVDPVSSPIGTGHNPPDSDFSKKLQISQSLDLSLSYLF